MPTPVEIVILMNRLLVGKGKILPGTQNIKISLPQREVLLVRCEFYVHSILCKFVLSYCSQFLCYTYSTGVAQLSIARSFLASSRGLPRAILSRDMTALGLFRARILSRCSQNLARSRGLSRAIFSRDIIARGFFRAVVSRATSSYMNYLTFL